MKKVKFTTMVAAMCVMATGAVAQKIKVTEGDLGALKGVNSLKVQYDYSNFKVGGKTEAEYIADKKEAYNKKEAGKGDTWEKACKADREGRYQRHFEDLFEKQADIDLNDDGSDKYTMIFKTTFIEPGYNIYVSRKNAELDGEVWFVETANPSNVVAKMKIENCKGRTFGGNDYDTGVRIEEAYELAGKSLGKYLKKEIN